MIVPAQGFDFYMFSQHIHAGIFHLPDIVDKCLIGSRCVKSVRPVTLIQYSVHKVRSVIQVDSVDSI